MADRGKGSVSASEMTLPDENGETEYPLIFNGPFLPGGDISCDPRAGSLCTPSTSAETNNVERRDNSTSTEDELCQPAPPMLALPPPPSYNTVVLPSISLDDNGHRYVGLVNQAMTCYLNSLIQTLYMTPEFRNAIYEWKFSGGVADEARSIPCQLQKLFLLLQTSDRESLETRDLTASFGWSGGEAYDQHDVQELCRIMFDALEQKWRKTNNSSLIQDLYRGNMEDFVKCLKCQTESIKEDVFLDLPLAVKQFGATDAFRSVEEALHSFIKPEVLDGGNQYFCEKCNRKQDAQKGLRITQFPYLLTIQLKRFDFDYNTLHRIKLNDKMTFPDLLNLNEFVYDASQNADLEPPKKMSFASAVASRRKTPAPPPAPPTDYVAQAERQVGHIDQQEVEALVKKDGPFVYELFSVMVHQGSAAGGHYFAYIKNMDQDAWFCFNDSSVTPATVADIHRSFGGSAGGWSSSNTNAYMLMYRKIDPKRNERFVKTKDLPAHLKDLLHRWETEEEEKLQRKLYQESLVNVNVLYNGGVYPELADTRRLVKVPHTSKLIQLFEVALEAFPEENRANVENIRLLKCTGFTFNISRAFSDCELLQKTILDVFPSSASVGAYRPDIFVILDTKPASMQRFYEIKEDCARTVKVIPVNLETNSLLPMSLVQFADDETVASMKVKVGQLYGYRLSEVHKLRLVLDKGFISPPFLLLLDDPKLTSLKVMADITTTTMYADVGSSGPRTDDDRLLDFAKSQMFKILERKKYAMTLTIRLPNELDFKQAGMSAPDSLIASRSTTPVVGHAIGCTAISSATKVIDLADLQAEPPLDPYPLSLPTASNASSHLSSASSNLSDDENDVNTMEGCHSESVSPACTPMVSPSVSEAGDLSDTNEGDDAERMERYERTFNAVLAASEQNRLADVGMVSPSPLHPESTAEGSSGGTITGGTQTVTSTGGTSSSHEVVVLNRVCNDISNEVVVSVDGRQLVSNLKEWLSEFIGVDVGQFVVLKHYKEDDDGYESNTGETETARDAYSTVTFLSVKLRSPLKENEKLIRVVRFDMENPEHEKWPYLFGVAASADMQVKALLQKCRDMYENMYAQNYDLTRLRLREMVTGVGVPLMNCGDHLGRRGYEWNRNVYLQILSDEQMEAYDRINYGYPVMVRRWNPTTVEVSPVAELIISAARDDHVFALKERIAAVFRVRLEKIELSEAFPTNAWTKWPFSKDRLELLDSVVFTSAGKMPATGTFNGKLIYFRLAGEIPKVLTEEERRVIRIKDNAAKTNDISTFRRRERPLRIQLSTSISEDSPMGS